MDKLETSLAQLELREVHLGDKRAAAVAALAMATTARQHYHHEGDLADDKLDAKLQADVDTCLSKLTGLDADIAALQAKIEEAKRQIAAERTAAERKAASEKLARDLAAVEKALPACLDAGRRFVSALEALHFNFEAQQMAAFLANVLSQIEVASAFTLQELQGAVDSIVNGSMQIPAPKPEAVSPQVPAPSARHSNSDPIAQARFTPFDRGIPERKIALEVPRS